MRLLRQRHVIALIIVFAVCSGRPAPAQNTPVYEGERVLNISFEPEHQPLEGRELFELLPLKRGLPYHASDVRASIERLYASGRYQDIQVDVSVASGGLNVKFITRNSWFIGNISTESDINDPPNRGQIVNASRLRLGEPFDPEQMPAAIEGIRRLLVANGYFAPDITPSFRYDDMFQQVHVNFTINTGKRARFTEPRITGDVTVLSKEDIIKATGWRRFLRDGYTGITASGTRRGIDHIRLKYTNSNRILATVVLDGIRPLDARRGEPSITVNPGRRINITTKGARVPRKDLRDAVPLFEEHAIDNDLLAEGTNNLRSYFQSQGYFDAVVSTPGLNESGSATEIEYVVDRGLLHRLVRLEITGNRYFDSKTIRERMFIAPRSFESPRGRYSEAYRRRDTEAIQGLYQSNGFRDVSVTSQITDNDLGKKGDIGVAFTISEGAQYTVSGLQIKGPDSLDIAPIMPSLGSQPGQPFSEFNIAADRQAIIAWYGEHGFPSSTFEWDARPGTAPHTFDLTFTITEGERQSVREVVITGLRTTMPELVNKQIGLNPG